MKTLSRRILVGALSLIFLNSACGPYSLRKPTPVGTILPGVEFPTTVPAGSFTATTGAVISTTITPLIPITGENVVSMQCQFCVDSTAHAVLIFPEFAFFDVVTTTPATCLTAQIVNGQRVLICRGDQLSTFTLNICSDPSNCLQFPVTFEACPLIPVTGAGTPVTTFTPVTPYFLTPINTLRPPARGPTLAPTQTPIVPPPSTPTPALPPEVTPTPVPPTQSPPTEPPPTEPPPPTIEPTDPPPTDAPSESTAEPKPTKKPPKKPKP